MSTAPGYWSEKRYEVAHAYPGKKWFEKVSKMPESQVYEIWTSLQRRKEKARNDEHRAG